MAWKMATALSFKINSRKKDTRIQVGDIVTLEGGIGHSYLQVSYRYQRHIDDFRSAVATGDQLSFFS